MHFQTTGEELEHRALLLSQKGMSRRAIARVLQVGRNRVRSILERHKQKRREPATILPAKPKRARRPSKLDPYRQKVTELLEQYPDITAQRVYEEIQLSGFDGGHTIVKELVRKLRPAPKVRISLPTPEYGPAQMAESDWSTYKINFTHAPKKKLQCFAYVLNYSRRKCFSFHERADMYSLMEGHVQAFERLGGAAHSCKYDGQKAVVLRREGRQPIYNPRFIAFATYYEFSPVACRPYHPNDKPNVERSFYELEKSFFNGRSFRDEADLNRQLQWWLDEICDKRYHKHFKNTALERFAEEKEHLRPLPAHPYDTARVSYRLCDLEGCVAWEGNRYEVPYKYVTDILPIRVTARELWVYAPNLICIARHELRPKGAGARIFLPGRRRAKTRHGPDLDHLRVTYEALGPQAAQYLEGLESSQPRSAGYHARKILALRQRYETTDLLHAMGHALQYQAFDHRAIERILLSQAKPRRLDEYVAEATAKKLEAIVGQSHTEPRRLEEYDDLPCRKGDTPTCPKVEESPLDKITDKKPTSKPGSGNTSESSD